MSESNNESVKENYKATAINKLKKNLIANKAAAEKGFPNEEWIEIDKLKLSYFNIPEDAAGIPVAKSRLPKNKQEELDFIKEIKSAIILKSKGASVTLVPRINRPDGKGFVPGPDAIVNGLFFEFKTITGKLNKVGRRFKYSRKQGDNVYIRIENNKHTKTGIIQYLVRLINNPKYKGGYKGIIILTIETGFEEKTYFIKIKDLKK